MNMSELKAASLSLLPVKFGSVVTVACRTKYGEQEEGDRQWLAHVEAHLGEA